MLIVYLLIFKLLLELIVVDLLENVLETAVVTLQNRVLCRQEHWPFFHERILETGIGKSANTLKMN